MTCTRRPGLCRPRALRRRRRLRAAGAACARAGRRAGREGPGLRPSTSPACAACGGAGFPTGRKWRLVRSEPAPRCMASTPTRASPARSRTGTTWRRDPHRFLEGTLVAACVVEAERSLHLSARRVPGSAARSCCTRSRGSRRPGWSTGIPPAAPRGGRLHLRRGVRDDREHRGQARLPAPPPALRRPGRRCSAGRR